jgi:hypothetical protein
MRIRAYNLMVLVLALFVIPIMSEAKAETTASREYQVKAAFLYNFIMFVEWPAEKMADINDPIIVGIIGSDPFGDAFDPVKDKKVKGKNVVIKRFKGIEELKTGGSDKSKPHPQIEAIRECHVLFICSSEKTHLKEIISLIENDNVLTVSDVENFLDAGGIINFVMEEKKVQFEISVVSCEKANLKISSKLLRLAKRVVQEGADEKNQKHAEKDEMLNRTTPRSEYVCHTGHDNKT